MIHEFQLSNKGRMMDARGKQMDQIPKTTHPSSLLVTRVMQGIMLGTVFAIPVALWAYTQANPPSPVTREEVAASATRAAKRSQPVRKPVRVKDATTVPASQMHVRIDDGSRPSNN